MAANVPDSKVPQAGSLQAMLARLRGMVQALKSTDTLGPERAELLPTWDALSASSPETADSSPATPAGASNDNESCTQPAAAGTASEGDPASPAAVPADPPPPCSAAEPPPGPQLCPQCSSPRPTNQAYCDNCGWIFPEADAIPLQPTASRPTARIGGRYELGQLLCTKGRVERFRALDFESPEEPPVPVIILRGPKAPAAPLAVAEPVAADSPEPTPDVAVTGAPQAEVVSDRANDPPPFSRGPAADAWPALSWEQALLAAPLHPALPQPLGHFSEGDFEYVVEELPQGRIFWDAWDDPAATAEQRFAWLRQVAEALQRLHERGAVLEGLRPDIVVVDESGRARLMDLSDLLPLPMPPDPPIRATCYTAPELVLQSEQADARADLYSFGAMLYALHLGRELTELDFELAGLPKSILQRFPDVHPLFGRLLSKTFCRELSQRFPSEEAAAADPTGFTELIATLNTCVRTLDEVRLGIAAWTTTGMVRTGNEDAFAILSCSQGHESGLSDCALVLLADGMGGSEAGEVAAAMAIATVRDYLLQQEPFALLAGKAPIRPDQVRQAFQPDAHPPDPAVYEGLLATALKEANKAVYAAARSDSQKSGMGCTVEAVYLSGREFIVAHVGDSRTYHLHEGQLTQLTQDQTWVQRMVELGVLSAEEALSHPRRSDLQQAIGGYPEVEPAVYRRPLRAGDWVVVCSDGISNHLPNDVLQEILLTATSPEGAARRLVNLVNLHGATDNATVVVIHAT